MTSAVNLFPRTQTNVADTAKEIAVQAEKRVASRGPAQLDRRRYDILKNELDGLTFQLEHRRACVDKIAPGIDKFSDKIAALKAAQAQLAASNTSYVRFELDQLDAKIKHFEPLLKDEEERLARSENLVKHWTKMIKDWHQANDAEYQQLRALEQMIAGAVPRPGSITSSGGGHGIGDWYAEPK